MSHSPPHPDVRVGEERYLSLWCQCNYNLSKISGKKQFNLIFGFRLRQIKHRRSNVKYERESAQEGLNPLRRVLNLPLRHFEHFTNEQLRHIDIEILRATTFCRLSLAFEMVEKSVTRYVCALTRS